jgi:transketolase
MGITDVETVDAWRVIIDQRHQPVALILTRQAVPRLDREHYGTGENPA